MTDTPAPAAHGTTAVLGERELGELLLAAARTEVEYEWRDRDGAWHPLHPGTVGPAMVDSSRYRQRTRMVAEVVTEWAAITQVSAPSWCIPGRDGCHDGTHAWPCPEHNPSGETKAGRDA